MDQIDIDPHNQQVLAGRYPTRMFQEFKHWKKYHGSSSYRSRNEEHDDE